MSGFYSIVGFSLFSLFSYWWDSFASSLFSGDFELGFICVYNGYLSISDIMAGFLSYISFIEITYSGYFWTLSSGDFSFVCDSGSIVWCETKGSYETIS